MRSGNGAENSVELAEWLKFQQKNLNKLSQSNENGDFSSGESAGSSLSKKKPKPSV